LIGEYLLICSAAFLTSALTLLSGFGLGTLLLPAFVVFFPVEIAVALTAIVHLLNNLFKLALLGKYAEKEVILKFGVPAIVSAFIGAWVLVWFSGAPALGQYRVFEHEFVIEPVKIIIAILMMTFAVIEAIPGLQRLSIGRNYLPLGGLLSGFFGGLSGHQGAFRSIFLLRSGLSKESYLGTGIVIACLIDVTRLSVYSRHFSSLHFRENGPLLAAAVIAAFLGAVLGNRLVEKVTLRWIQITVSVLLVLIAISLAAGVL
jgi:hypothetical protein